MCITAGFSGPLPPSSPTAFSLLTSNHHLCPFHPSSSITNMHFSTFVLSALALASSAAALAIKPQQNLESGLAARDTQDCLRYFYPESSVGEHYVVTRTLP